MHPTLLPQPTAQQRQVYPFPAWWLQRLLPLLRGQEWPILSAVFGLVAEHDHLTAAVTVNAICAATNIGRGTTITTLHRLTQYGLIDREGRGWSPEGSIIRVNDAEDTVDWIGLETRRLTVQADAQTHMARARARRRGTGEAEGNST